MTSATSTDDQQGLRLDEKTVVIFGGTSGIGLSAALQASASGANVFVIGFGSGSAEIAEKHGFEGGRTADVTRPETITASLADIPHVDHLVLLAGTFVAGKLMEADMSYLRKAFEERVWAAAHTLRVLGDRLSKEGSVTFISGALADRPNAYGTAILASASAAMEALARGLVLELSPIRVNTLSPGAIDTPLLAKVLGDGYGAMVDSWKKTFPLHRLGTPADAGAAVVFLMTNKWMNGATLNIDGGTRLV